MTCNHEPFQGRCVHCDVPFVNGHPAEGVLPPGAIWPIARLFVDSGGNIAGDSHLYAPGLPEGVHNVYPLPVNADEVPIATERARPPTDGERWSIDRAADFLEWYAGYIREVKPDDLERHPYLPELDYVAGQMRDWFKLRQTPAGVGPVGAPSRATQAETMARRLLWIAFCWNDHNFDPAHEHARKETEALGIKSFEDANAWLTAGVKENGNG